MDRAADVRDGIYLVWTELPFTVMFSPLSSSIKQALFFAPQLLLQCSFLEREIGLHNQSVLVEVGKQRMSWAPMNATFLVCRVVLPGNGSTGEQIFVLWFGHWVLEGAAGTCCFCLGCCEKQLKHSIERAGLVLQREGVETSGDNDKQCWGLHSCYRAFDWEGLY